MEFDTEDQVLFNFDWKKMFWVGGDFPYNFSVQARPKVNNFAIVVAFDKITQIEEF